MCPWHHLSATLTLSCWTPKKVFVDFHKLCLFIRICGHLRMIDAPCKSNLKDEIIQLPRIGLYLGEYPSDAHDRTILGNTLSNHYLRCIYAIYTLYTSLDELCLLLGLHLGQSPPCAQLKSAKGKHILCCETSADGKWLYSGSSFPAGEVL